MSALVRNTLISTLFLVVGVFAADVSKRDAEKARQAWMSGYLKIESAAKAVEEEKFMFALELYEEALATFQEVGVRYPEWNPDVVNFRISYCTEKVRELRETAEIAAEKMSRPDLIRTVNHLRKQRGAFESVKDKLQADLKAAQERVADLQKQADELAAARAEADRLRHANEALAAEKTGLESRIADLEKGQAAARAASEAAVAAVQSKLAQAEAGAAEAEGLRQSLAAKAAELEAANSRIGELAGKLAQAEAGAGAAEGLRQSLAAKAAELEAANSRIAELAGRLAKTEEERVAERQQVASLRSQIEELQAAKGAAAQTDAALKASEAKREELAGQLAAMARQADELRASDAEKAVQIASMRLKNEAAEARAAAAERLAEERAESLAKATAAVAEREGKIKKMEALIEQTDALDIDAVATQARTATAELKKAEARLAEVQKALLARTEAENRLIAERNRQIEAENEAARAKRAREEKLHGHLTTAAALMEGGKREQALKELEEVLKMEPNHPQATAHKGLLKAELAGAEVGDDADAERVLAKAYELDPKNEDVLLRLGFVQLRQEKVAAAAGTLLHGAALAPKRAEFRHYAGVACQSLGWPIASEKLFREALELNPKSGDTAYNLAVLLATLDEPRIDEAKEWYKKALDLGVPPNTGMENFFKEH